MAWYEETFNEDYLALYRPLIDGQTAEQVDGLLALCPLEHGAPILDLCCGHGRHAIALAARGFRVTGFDLSRPFLNIARTEAEARGISVSWVKGDMRQLPFNGEYVLVIQIFSSFGYFADEEQDRRVLIGVYRALQPGGYFFQDVSNPSWTLRHVEPYFVLETENRIVTEWNSFDADGRRYITRHEVVDRREGRSPRNYLKSIRAYEAHEIASMLRDAGFDVTGQWGDFKGRPLDAQAPRLITLARRPAE